MDLGDFKEVEKGRTLILVVCKGRRAMEEISGLSPLTQLGAKRKT